MKFKSQAKPNRHACLVVVTSYVNDPLRKLNFKETDVLYCCQVITGVPFKMDFVRNSQTVTNCTIASFYKLKNVSKTDGGARGQFATYNPAFESDCFDQGTIKCLFVVVRYNLNDFHQ